MGLNQHYQAMPPDCELLRRSRFDPEFGGELAFFSYFSDRIAEEMRRADAASATFNFLAEMLALMTDRPGIEKRHLYFGRRWNMPHFLLSAERRGEPSAEPDWAYRAILGGEILHPETKSGIGISIKYLSPAEVFDIWNRLHSLNIEEIAARWNMRRMEEACDGRAEKRRDAE